jgi:hypothetical protein
MDSLEEEPKREIDPERAKLQSLFYPLARKYGEQGEQIILAYIEQDTEVAPIVVTEWLKGIHQPSPSICRLVLGSLRYFRPESIPPQEEPVKPPTAVPEPEADREKLPGLKPRSQNPQKKRVIAVDKPPSPAPEPTSPQPARPKKERARAEGPLRDFGDQEREAYRFMLDHNPTGTSIYLDNLRLPKGYGLGRKIKFASLLCNLGLMRDDGNWYYTILPIPPKLGYSTEVQKPSGTLPTPLLKSEEHQERKTETLRRMREYLKQPGIVPPDEEK